jgi:hypothetical protein
MLSFIISIGSFFQQDLELDNFQGHSFRSIEATLVDSFVLNRGVL